MDGVRIAVWVGVVAVAALAFRVRAVDRGHTAFALFATWMVGGDFARLVAQPVLIGHVHPHAGMLRVAFHLSQLVVLSWGWCFAALCVHYFWGRGARAVLAVFAAVFVVVVVTYPWLTGPLYLSVYKASYAATTAAVWLIIVSAILRRRDVRPSLAHLLVILYAATDVVVLAFPMLGPVVAQWPLSRVATIACAFAQSVAQVAFLVRHRRSSALVAHAA